MAWLRPKISFLFSLIPARNPFLFGLLFPHYFVFGYAYGQSKILYFFLLFLSVGTLLLTSFLAFCLSRWKILGFIPLGLSPEFLFLLLKIILPFSLLRGLLSLSSLTFRLVSIFRPELLSPSFLWNGGGKKIFSLFSYSRNFYGSNGGGIPPSWNKGHILAAAMGTAGAFYVGWQSLEESRRQTQQIIQQTQEIRQQTQEIIRQREEMARQTAEMKRANDIKEMEMAREKK